MKRRAFIQVLGGLVAGVFVSNIAAFYVPGKPWSVAVPKPPSPQDEFWLPERLAEAIVRAQDDCFISDPRVS